MTTTTNGFYVLRRRGHFFSSSPEQGVDWCKDDKHSCFKYVATIISNEVKNGILIYHDDIIETINNSLPKGTCENMVSTIADAISNYMESNNLKWAVIHVRLFAHDIDNNAMPKANMEFVKIRKFKYGKLLSLISN